MRTSQIMTIGASLLFATSFFVAWFACDDQGNTVDMEAMNAAVAIAVFAYPLLTLGLIKGYHDKLDRMNK